MLMVSKDWFYNFEAKMGKMLQIVIMNSRWDSLEMDVL
jgi:hypothetical protein